MNNENLLSKLKVWFRRTGKLLYLEEKHLINQAVENLFGYFIVQFGAISDEPLLETSRIQQKILLESHLGFQSNSDIKLANEQLVIADFDFLPFAEDSLDVILLPHVLESALDSHLLLRQIDSMLRAEGHLVITGFNPRGLSIMFKRWFSRQDIFAQSSLESPQCIQSWLEVLGYETKTLTYSQSVFFINRPENKIPRWLQSVQQVFHKLGFANVYCLVAKKKVDSPTLVGLKWHMPRWQKVGNSSSIRNRETINPSKKSAHD